MSSAAATSPPAALKAKCIDLLLSYVAQPKEEYLASAGDLASVFVSEGCQVADIAELQLEACWAVGQQQPEMSFRKANEWVLPFFMELFIGFERGMAAAASERDRVVAALAHSELNYRTIFDNSRSGIVILDTDGFVQLCNDAIRTMLGYGHGELEGRHIRSFTHADEAELIEGRLTALLAGASIPKVSRMRLMRRDGERLEVETIVTRIQADSSDSGGEHVDANSDTTIDPPAAGFVVEVRDVTRRLDGERRADRLRRAPAP